MVSSVRGRIVGAKYGRRGRQDDPEYGIKRLLLRNLEALRDEQREKLWNTLVDDPQLTDLHTAWIAKEHLPDLLALRITRAHTTPATSAVRDCWTSLLVDDLLTPGVESVGEGGQFWDVVVVGAP